MQLHSFELISLHKCSEKNLQFLNSLYSDSLFQKFFGRMHVENTKSGDSIFNNTYVVQKDGACIGYVSIAHHIIRGDIMATTIYYGVAHQYRNRGLGSQIVKEISDYLLTREDINMVIMNINVENIYSQKAATKAGFTYTPEFSDDEELQFIKK